MKREHATLALWLALSLAPAVEMRAEETTAVDYPFLGVTHITRTGSVPDFPRNVKIHVVRIDLTAPHLSFRFTPHSGTRDTHRETTLQYLNDTGAQIAINGCFFGPFPSADLNADCVGFAASDGDVYSPFELPAQNFAIVRDAPAINIDPHNHASIVHRAPAYSDGTCYGLCQAVDGLHVQENVTVWNAFSGSAQIVTGGVKTIPCYLDATHPGCQLIQGTSDYSNSHSWYDVPNARTAIGIGCDEKTLILFTVDKFNGSQGMTVPEVADLLIRDYGVCNALNMDGGGSTSLAMLNPTTGIGAYVNSPSDNFPIGRTNASGLAVFAARYAAAATWTPDQMLRVKGVADVQVSPDGLRVAFTVTEHVIEAQTSEPLSEIWIAEADGSRELPLARGSFPHWSPDGKWIAFLSDHSGATNIWRIRPDGGDPQQLTRVKRGVAGFQWSHDSAWIAFGAPVDSTAEEDQRHKEKTDWEVVGADYPCQRLWLIRAEPDATPRLLTPQKLSLGGAFGGGWLDWSPDDRRLVFAHMPRPQFDDWRKTDISEVEIGSGRIRTVAATPAAEDSPLYSPDGLWIAYRVSDIPPGWGIDFRVYVVPASGGSARPLAETFNREPALVGWTADSRSLIVEETRGTSQALYRLPLDGPPAVLFAPGRGSFPAVALNGPRNTLGFAKQESAEAPEAFVSLVEPVAPRQVSRVNADLPTSPLGETRVIRWNGPGDFPIEGLLTLPSGYREGRRYPLLVIMHGGPPSSFTQTFIANASPYPTSAFAERGYAVLRPNIRGSTGYGKDFRYANYGDWGGKDFEDMMDGVDYLVAQGIADPERLGVMGWSYGGYMTAWTVTQTRRFKAASIGAPITDLASLNGTADMATFVPDYFGGEAWEKPQLYLQRSPLYQVNGVSTPVLLQHGELDTICPLSQSREFYDALIKRGVAVRMTIYPRSGHGVREPKFVRQIMQENLDWFEQHLR
jgi:dipeptidyl aminopeptidase/acylaminoacyl peptidase